VERRERWARVLAPPAWACAVLIGSGFPAARAALPVLRLLRGPLGVALALLAIAISAAPLLEGRVRPWAPRPATLFGLSAAVLTALGLYYAGGLRVSGDEPHYLLMAQSLWREADLDLRDNFDRGDYREYLPALPAPHYGAPRLDGRPFPAHSPGLPALLAPVYALGGRPACVVLLALFAAGLGVEVRRLAEHATGDAASALFAWAAAIGPPVAFYAFHMYTEIPSALALALALRLLLEAPGPGEAALAALLASALPWLHVKMIPAAAALGLVALLRLRGRSLAAFGASAGLMAVAFLAYYQWVLGTPTPLALYGGVPQGVVSSPLVASVGLLLDRSFGLLTVAPVFLLAAPGIVLLARGRGWREVWPHVAVGAAVLAPLLTWRMWWGGQCPPGRFLVPLIPLLGVAVAARLAATPRGLARWRWALVAVGGALTLFMTASPEAMLLLNRRDRATRVWDALAASGGADLNRYLPSLVPQDPAEARVAALWVGALGFLLLLDQLAARQDRVDRWFRGLGLPLVLWLAIGVGVDRWARAGARSPQPEPAAESDVSQLP
jgi:hypothetical protein